MRAGGYIVAVCAGLAAMAVTAGCISGTEALAADVSPEGWTEPAEMVYPNTDTLTPKEITLTLRHNSTLEYSEGDCLVEMVSPSGERTARSVHIAMPSVAVQAGRLHETGAVVDPGTLLDEAGDWRFTVTPAKEMRGVWSVAIELIDNGKR